MPAPGTCIHGEVASKCSECKVRMQSVFRGILFDERNGLMESVDAKELQRQQNCNMRQKLIREVAELRDRAYRLRMSKTGEELHAATLTAQHETDMLAEIKED